MRISSRRIQNGGGLLPFGSWYSAGTRTSAFSNNSTSADSTKPISGENSSALPTPSAWFQSTPLVPDGPLTIWFIRPTPMIEPTSVCELDDGNPKYQVARFHVTAAISSENTIAKPEPLPTCRISSTGSNCRIPNATAPLDTSTPNRFQRPDHTTARCGSSECV